MSKSTVMHSAATVSQEELDKLLSIQDFIGRKGNAPTLVEEIHTAILDSGSLKLNEWERLRNKLKEIEELIPHIDLIIQLKQKYGDKKVSI